METHILESLFHSLILQIVLAYLRTTGRSVFSLSQHGLFHIPDLVSHLQYALGQVPDAVLHIFELFGLMQFAVGKIRFQLVCSAEG